MSKCKGCGKEILWAKNENGKMVPLDMKAPVYQVTQFDETRGHECVNVKETESVVAYVSHFATCPKANEFSSSKKAKKP